MFWFSIISLIARKVLPRKLYQYKFFFEITSYLWDHRRSVKKDLEKANEQNKLQGRVDPLETNDPPRPPTRPKSAGSRRRHRRRWLEDQAASKKAAKKAIQRKPSCFANGVAKTTNSGQINLNFAWKEQCGSDWVTMVL